MTLSRTVPGLLLAFAAAPGEALPPIDYRLPPPSHEQPFEPRTRCASPYGDEEIVVCGTRDDGSRRVPVDRVPGARQRLVAGEPPSAMAALNMRDCIQRCPSSVGVAIDVVQLFSDPVSALRDALHIRR
jgi:hypothetical protein